MATVNIPFASDAAHTVAYCTTYGDPRTANWTVTGTTDYGTAVLTASDSKYVTAPGSGVPALDFTLLDTGLIPSGSTINSVTITTSHKVDAGTVWVSALISGVCADRFSVAYDQTKVLTSTSFTEYTAVHTTDPVTGAAWTTANLYTRNFYINITSMFGGAAAYDVDKFYLVVDYTAPTWWTLSSLSADLIEDAQSLADTVDATGNVTATALAQMHTAYDATIGSAYIDWIYYYFRRARITLPQARTIHWYYYAFTAPGTAWTATGAPSEHGWFQSTDKFASSANLIIGDIPNNPRDWTEIVSFAAGNAGMLGGFPGVGVNFRNHFIYADGGYTVGTDSPTMRIFDGLSDRTITTIPNTSTGVIPKAIISMLLVGEVIYFSTLDSGSDDTDFAGRVFSYEPLSGVMAQVGSGFSGGEVPYALCWHMNRLWCGTNQGSGAAGKIYFFRPGIDTAWTADYTLSTSTVGGCCSLASYKGQLFIGSDNADAVFAKVLVRSALGAYTTSLTATGGTAKVNNGFLSMLVFESNLYATYWNEDTTAIAKIYKYDNTSWTTVYTGSAGLLRPYVGLYETDGTMLVVGGGRTLSSTLLSTTNGTSYTDRTSSLTGGSTASPVIGEVVI